MLPDIAEQGAPRMTERHVLDMLCRRYSQSSMGAHRYAWAEHVPSRPLFGPRIADFIAVDCWTSGGAPFAVHGHEVKVSRSDWLTELRDPTKADAFRPYMDFWWLVAAHRDIVRDDLPEGWGLMVVAGGALRVVTKAPRLTPEPMPRPMLASLLRATAKTARRADGGPA